MHVPYDQVYGQGIEDMLHRDPVDREDRRRRSAGSPTRTLDDILADVIAHERSRSGVSA